jgi:Spy/CpxP family protein refolding chaperone
MRLSSEQKQQIKSIRTSARDQAAIIRHDTTLTAAQAQEKLQALRKDTRERINSVLTPEQQKAAAQFKENGKTRFAAKLGLTPDQQSRMKDTMKAAKEQREAVLHNSGLSQDDKAAQLKQIRENTHAQMAQILTPEQQQKLQRFRGTRKTRGMRGAKADL